MSGSGGLPCTPLMNVILLGGTLSIIRAWTWSEDAELTPLLRLGVGACAGIIAISATYPMDLVRGRLTIQSGNSPGQYRG
ncbi:hypothetical protein AgCh_039817 [Apium graveolens]